MSESTEQCVRCGRTSAEVPLLRLQYQQHEYWICPQDLPVLIHRPEQIDELAGNWTQRGTAEH